MNISETCIRRPVLTTLMTASLIVFGVFAYRLLPVAALPAVDFPTIQITAHVPGRQPGNHGGLGRVADRAAAVDDLRHLVDDLVVVARLDPDHHPVRPRPQHRRRLARRADRARDGAAPAAGRNDDPAVLPQGQSGRLPGAVRQHALRHHAAVGGRRLRRNGAGAADLAIAGRRAGAGLWRAEIRRARAGRSGRGGGAQHLARRHPHRGGQGQFQHAGRRRCRARAKRNAAGHRRNAARGRLPRRGRGLPQRRAGQARRRSPA